MTTANANLDTEQYVQVSDTPGAFILQSHRDTVRIVFSVSQPVKSNPVFHEIGGSPKESMYVTPHVEFNIWALALTDRSKLSITRINTVTPVTLLDDSGDSINAGNPLPVRDIDYNNRPSLNTLFGEKLTGRRVPSFAAQFQYGIATDQADTVLVNGGTAETVNSMLQVSSGTDVAGSALIQTTDYLRYIPGHEAYTFFTGIFTQGVADSYQRAGIFDDEDGFFIGYEGTDFCVTRRRDGVDSNTVINIADVFVEQDGVFDPTLGNVYKISFGYLGFASVNYEVMAPCGCWRLLYRIPYPNTAVVTHITQTNLPARAEVANTGNDTDIVFYSGSYEVGIVDGTGVDPVARRFSVALSNQTITAGDYLVVIFRNKDTFKSIENRISAQLILVSATTEVNRPVTWSIVKNMTITNTPTWTDVNTDDSVFDYSTDAVVTANTGDLLIPWNMSSNGSFFEQVQSQEIKLRPGETAAVVLNSPLGTNGNVSVAFRWEEFF